MRLWNRVVVAAATMPNHPLLPVVLQQHALPPTTGDGATGIYRWDDRKRCENLSAIDGTVPWSTIIVRRIPWRNDEPTRRPFPTPFMPPFAREEVAFWTSASSGVMPLPQPQPQPQRHRPRATRQSEKNGMKSPKKRPWPKSRKPYGFPACRRRRHPRLVLRVVLERNGPRLTLRLRFHRPWYRNGPGRTTKILWLPILQQLVRHGLLRMHP